MTVQNPPVFIQAGSHPAEDVRRWTDALVGGREGIVGSTDFAVTEKSGTPNMSVDVAGGRAFIAGSEATYQGMYFLENRGVENVVLPAADATNPRKDLIVAYVGDQVYSGAVSVGGVAAVTGTPAASPAEPSLAAYPNALVLAMVDVPANDTAITNSQITDRRITTSGQGRAAALGGIITCTSATRPSHVEGRVIYETDTDKVLTSDGSAWNRALAFDGIFICTSGTRPAHQEGRVIYETDTDVLKMSNGSAWNDVAPATSLFVRKTANESVTSSTTLQNDDQLVLAVAANTTYVLDMMLIYSGAEAGDLQLNWTVPTGATMDYRWDGPPTSITGTSDGDTRYGALNAPPGTSTAIGATAGNLIAFGRGLLVVGGTAGNVQLQWAQSSSSGTATTIKSNSYMRLTKVA